MSFTQIAPWTPSEKVELLVNVLRSTIPDLPFFLMQILHDKGIYPKWNDTPLPAGRSLGSSQIIYEEMGRPFKQQGPYSGQPVGSAHVPQIAPALPGRRPYAEYEPYPPAPQQQQQQQQQRTLQPRPPRSTDSPAPVITNGEVHSVMRQVVMSEPAQEPQRKKRGRPSKEEAEERDRALAAEGKVYQPKKRPVKKARPSLDTPSSARMANIDRPAEQTPPLRTPEAREEGSSGKRRSKRQPPEQEVHIDGSVEDHDFAPQAEAQSPSDRLLATHRERDLDIRMTRETPTSSMEATPKVERPEH